MVRNNSFVFHFGLTQRHLITDYMNILHRSDTLMTCFISSYKLSMYGKELLKAYKTNVRDSK